MESNKSSTTIEPTYEEKVEKYKQSWDNFSDVYFTYLNKTSLCLMSTLMSLARVSNKYTILDAGCGPGLGTKLLTSGVPSKNTTIYAFDFSKKMVELCNTVFTEMHDFNSNKNNHWEITSYPANSKINVEKDIQDLRQEKVGKIVKFFEGNAESLIFEDEQFDAYLSSLCLMLCIDTDKAISEAYRVLKPEGIATFAIWGNEKESKLIHHLFNDVFIKHGLTYLQNDKNSFWLAKDTNALRERFTKAGFKDVRMEYTNEIYDCYNLEDFLLAFAGPSVKAALSKIGDDEKANQILEEVKENARQAIVENKQLAVLNCLIIVAFK